MIIASHSFWKLWLMLMFFFAHHEEKPVLLLPVANERKFPLVALLITVYVCYVCNVEPFNTYYISLTSLALNEHKKITLTLVLHAWNAYANFSNLFFYFYGFLSIFFLAQSASEGVRCFFIKHLIECQLGTNNNFPSNYI